MLPPGFCSFIASSGPTGGQSVCGNGFTLLPLDLRNDGIQTVLGVENLQIEFQALFNKSLQSNTTTNHTVVVMLPTSNNNISHSKTRGSVALLYIFKRSAIFTKLSSVFPARNMQLSLTVQLPVQLVLQSVARSSVSHMIKRGSWSSMLLLV
jgi:hypothetical protein